MTADVPMLTGRPPGVRPGSHSRAPDHAARDGDVRVAPPGPARPLRAAAATGTLGCSCVSCSPHPCCGSCSRTSGRWPSSCQRVLPPRLVHRAGDLRLHASKLRSGRQQRGLSDHHLAHGRAGGAGHPHRCACSPSRSRTTMARVASPRLRGLLVIAVLMPLWARYLVKVYAWRTMPARQRRARLALRAVRRQRARASGSGALLHRVHLPVAPVHDPADLRRPRTDSRSRCWKRRPTSAGAPA